MANSSSFENDYLEELLTALNRICRHLEKLLEVLPQPITEELLIQEESNFEFQNRLAALNERFSKLQDLLGRAFRHTALLLGEKHEGFLEVYAFFEKNDIVPDWRIWQKLRLLRNRAAHDYSVDFKEISDYFNEVIQGIKILLLSKENFVKFCKIKRLVS